MKTISLILLNICFLNLAFAGDNDKVIKVPFDSAYNKYSYRKIIQVDGQDAKILYLKAKKWYIDQYLKSTFLNDVENTTLVQTGQFDISAPVKAMGKEVVYSYKVTYSITSHFKDGKTKLEITNFKLIMMQPGATEESLEGFKKNCETRPVGAKVWTKHSIFCFDEIDKAVLKIIESFENQLKDISKTKSDW